MHGFGRPSFSWFGIVLDAIYPPRCRFCKAHLEEGDAACFCPACRRQIRRIGSPLCTACGRPFPGGEDHRCGDCLLRPPFFARARAWACYSRDPDEPDPLREVIQRFKYGRRVSLGKPLGRLMAAGCQALFPAGSLDALVPVPLHPQRLRWRGFNQALLLAREVSRRWGLPLYPFALARTKETLPQTELGEEERKRNVRGAFAVVSRPAVEGKRLLLVDDVYTSGATVNECARALRRGGAEEVSVLTLARTV
jgi:ComF family protein